MAFYTFISRKVSDGIVGEFDLAIALGAPVRSLAKLLAEAYVSLERNPVILTRIANDSANIERLFTLETVLRWPEEELPLFLALVLSMEYRAPASDGPCGPRERLIASLLTADRYPVSRRVDLWWRFVESHLGFPAYSRGARGEVPPALMDHPVFVTWNPDWRAQSVFHGSRAFSRYGVRPPRFENEMEKGAWQALGADSPCGLFMPFDLGGKKVPRDYLKVAFFYEAVEIVREWIGSPDRVAVPVEAGDVLAAAVASWNASSAIRLAQALEEERPGLIASTRDFLGNDLLWKTLSRFDREGAWWMLNLEASTRDRGAAAEKDLCRFLVEKGCDPDRKGPLGLSWNEMVQAR